MPGGYGGQAPGSYGYPPAPPTGGAERGVSGWIWAIGGAVAASAIWASMMFATGAFSGPSPDLAGYSYTDDLCAATSMTPFKNADFTIAANKASAASDTDTANPQHSGSRQDAVDTMWCNTSLKAKSASSSGYSSTWLYNTATLHKKTDPGPEFAAGYRAYEKQASSIDYRVERVTGIGDEAYLVTQKKKDGSTDASYMLLGVRDGWLTYQSTWSNYASSGASGTQPTGDEVATMLKTSAKETLQRLRDAESR
ncbi:hypothetical protein ACIRPT_08140 [Streptomyces sp. NPDC101227]|uniref:hypothetical protein n=1 Tax=Streptomyces sp. NPDC101227 TaxID=3366136 RepID=UPI00380B61B7